MIKMNNSTYVLLIVSAVFLVGTPISSFSESITTQQLFTDVSSSTITAESSNLEDIVSNISTDPLFHKMVIDAKYINIDRTVLDLDEFEITLFNGDTLAVTKDSVEYIEDWQHYVWYGSTQYDTSVNIALYDDGHMTATINTIHESYKIYSVDAATHIFAQLDFSILPDDHPPDLDISSSAQESLVSDASVSKLGHLPKSVQDQIELLTNSYRGDHDYRNDPNVNPVTIDVFFGYTSKVDDKIRNIDNKIRSAIMDANRSYIRSDLPLGLKLAGLSEIRGYNEISVSGDLANAANPFYDDLDQFRKHVKITKADIGIFLTHYDNDDDEILCGKANEILASHPDTSYAVIRDTCLSGNILAHEIGHLQGAGHNRDQSEIGVFNYENPVFSFGHGSYWIDGSVRSIMSNDCNYDDDVVDTCKRQDVWSSPFNNFQGTARPSGTNDNEYNAKVLYATAPYIASLRGETQAYDDDDVPPTARITAPTITEILEGYLVTITAIFDEALNDKYAPKVTLTHSGGSSSSTYTMKKVTSTKYKADVTLSDDIKGKITVSLSGARDLSGNKIVSNPTSGSSFEVISQNTKDKDNDGIADSVDTKPNSKSKSFSDKSTSNGGSTAGTVTKSGNQEFTITDSTNNSKGISISTTKKQSNNNAASTMSLCSDTVRTSMNHGDSVTVTCSSGNKVTLDADQGSMFTVMYTDKDASGKRDTYKVNMAKGTDIAFDPETSSLTNIAGGKTLAVKTALSSGASSETISVKPGKTVQLPTSGNNNPQPTSLFCDGKTISQLLQSNKYKNTIDNRDGSIASKKIEGTNDADLILASNDHDKILGHGGDDCIIGGKGNNVLVAGAGDDQVYGNGGKDQIYGQNGKDKLFGNDGIDTIKGGNHDDVIFGGASSDTIYGDAGIDSIDGGPGSNDKCITDSKDKPTKQCEI